MFITINNVMPFTPTSDLLTMSITININNNMIYYHYYQLAIVTIISNYYDHQYKTLTHPCSIDDFNSYPQQIKARFNNYKPD